MELTLDIILFLLKSFRPEVIRRRNSDSAAGSERKTYTGILYYIPGSRSLSADVLYAARCSVLKQALLSGRISENAGFKDLTFLVIPDENTSLKDLTFLIIPDESAASDQSVLSGENGPATCTVLSIAEAVDPAVIVNLLTEAFHRISVWDKKMHIGALEGKSPQELLDISEDILKHPVLLFDSAFQLLGHSKKYSTDNSGYQTAIRIGYTAPETMQRTRESNILSQLEPRHLLIAPAVEGEDFYNIYYAFQEKGKLLGYACIFCDARIPDNGYVDLAQIFFNNMNYCLQTHYGDSHFGQMMYETILLNLMHKEPVSEEWLSDRLNGITGLTEKGTYVLEVLEFRDLANISLDFLMRFLVIQFSSQMPFIFESRICFLFTFPEASMPSKAQVQDQNARLREALKTYRYIAGFSSVFHNIREIPYAYRQAAAALAFGSGKAPKETGPQLSGTKPDFENENIHDQNSTLQNKRPQHSGTDPSSDEKCTEEYFFTDFIHEYILSQAEKKMPLPLLQSELYRKLKEHDTEHHTAYLKTVMTYLYSDCNATKAAELLFVHRNTIRNVIRQIEEQFGITITDIRVKQQLVLSEQIDRYLGKH